jgi:hypothetical protein
MAAANTQEFTLHLPEDVIDMLRHASRRRRETPGQIVADALRFSLEPVREEALDRLKRRIRKQRSQSEPEVRAHLKASLTEEEEDRLSRLLERNRDEGLSPEEKAEMQGLFDRIESVATDKAAAIWLLSGRTPDSDASA